MSDSPPRNSAQTNDGPPLARGKAFLFGAIAPLVIYPVFYFFNLSALEGVAGEISGASGVLIGITTFVFLVVAAVCGRVTVACKPHNELAAFMNGLGVPSMILGASGFGAGGSKSEDTSGAAMFSAAPFATITAMIEPSVISKALQIVFNPVGTVVEVRTEKVTEEKNAVIVGLEERTARLTTETVELKRTIEASDQRASAQLVALKTDFERQLATAATNAAKLATDLEAAQATIALQTGNLDNLKEQGVGATVRSEKILKNLMFQRDELEQSLVTVQRERDEFQRQLKAQPATTTQGSEQVAQDVFRAFAELVKVGGPRSVDILLRSLGSARSPEVKIALIRFLAGLPGAFERSEVVNLLQKLKGDESKEVSEMAAKVLGR